MNQASKKKLQASLAIFILSAVIIGTAVISRPKSAAMVDTSKTTAATTSTKTTAPTTTATTASDVYKNGTYTAKGSYYSPAGQEAITVTLTLENDNVSAATVVSDANDPTASIYQSDFISGYKSHVIGKDVSTIKLSSVSGSSLTSQGFNSALSQIESEAKV